MTAFKILVAEDDLESRQNIGQLLVQHGFAVVCVEDGYQALEYALREKPDLLLLDVHMPAGDGFSVHDRVKLHPEVALKPVIYMTRDPSTEIEDVAAAHGAFTLLHKPFATSDLIDAIKAALRQQHPEAA